MSSINYEKCGKKSENNIFGHSDISVLSEISDPGNLLSQDQPVSGHILLTYLFTVVY